MEFLQGEYARELSLAGSMAILAVAATFVANLLGFFRIDPRTRPKLSWKVVCGIFGLFFLLQLLVIPSLIYLSQAVSKGVFRSSFQLSLTSQILFSAAASLISLAAFAIFLACLSDASQRAIMGRKRAWPFARGVLCWFFAFPLVTAFGVLMQLFVTWFFQADPKKQVAVAFVKSTMDNPPLFLVVFVMVVGFVPVVEEFLFRGCLQSWMTSKWKKRWAIPVASCIFALFHFSWLQGVNNIEILTSLFLLSCILGYVYEKEESLFASIGLHTAFNTMTIFFMVLDVDSAL